MPTMKTRQDMEARSVAEQAAEWLLILEEDREEDREAFADWLRQSPLHVGAFLRASAVDSLLSEFDRDKEIELETGPLVEEPDIAPSDEADGAFPAPVGASSRPRWVSPRSAWALAAASAILTLALGIAALSQTARGEQWKHYVTAVGEQRAVELEDGSVVYLGPDSRVDVQFVTDERVLRLEAGQAVFRVHHDATRPFRVHTGRTVVQAVGTEFDVHRVRGDAVVSVIEGVVQVTHERTLMQTIASPVTGASEVDLQPIRLTAGQEIRVARNGKAAAPAPAAVDHLQAWKERRLTFMNETLFTIADEFNRYNRTPKIRVEDAAAGEQRYVAEFAADDPNSLVDVLRRDPKLEVVQRGDEIVVRAQ